MHLFQVELFAAAHRQSDVLGGGEYVYQLEVLVNHTDAQIQRIAGGTDGHSLIADINLTLIGEVDTGNHIHQRGFAAAVLAQQGQYLAAAHPQGHILVGHDRAEGFGNVLQAHRKFVLRHYAGSFRMVL